MAPRIIKYILLLFILSSCRKDKGEIDYAGTHYPQNIGKIISRNCSVSGCHNPLSKDAAAKLSLSTWENMFQGTSNGAAVIPYRPDFSSLCFFTNTFSELGPIAGPTMPINASSLSREDYLALRDWIISGAPDNKGRIKFADNPSRSKLYVTNQLCDVVTVIDAITKLPMRYITVGTLPTTDFPVCVKVSPDNNYWYVSFLAYTGIFQKYDAVNDMFSSQLSLGPGVWSSFEITSDSKYAFCVDNSSPGKIAVVDLDLMTVITTYTNSNFVYPKNVAINNAVHKLYIGAENGNYVSVIDYNNIMRPIITEVILDGTMSLNPLSSNVPNNVLMDENNYHCYVSCKRSGEVKVIDVLADTILAAINLNTGGDMMASTSTGALTLFVSCTDDTISDINNHGSVKVIDMSTNQITRTIITGWQPHGIAVDELHKYVMVVNSNINPKGPAPHHVNGCGGRDGYVTFIDLNTLSLIPSKKFELANYPYAASIRK